MLLCTCQEWLPPWQEAYTNSCDASVCCSHSCWVTFPRPCMLVAALTTVALQQCSLFQHGTCCACKRTDCSYHSSSVQLAGRLCVTRLECMAFSNGQVWVPDTGQALQQQGNICHGWLHWSPQASCWSLTNGQSRKGI
jgi:hypothetical protein